MRFLVLCNSLYITSYKRSTRVTAGIRINYFAVRNNRLEKLFRVYNLHFLTRNDVLQGKSRPKTNSVSYSEAVAMKI